MSTSILLIGAGASRDAGMPLVDELTHELKKWLHGHARSEFPALFEAIARHDRKVANNYERFFEWLEFIVRGQMGSFPKLLRFRLEPHLVRAAQDVASVIKLPVWKTLRSRHQCATYRPGYLARLGGVVPDKGRLKVFTTNYDLCIEDACRSQGIDVITGFRPSTGQWSPSLFRRQEPGINLYKLHGSLNWSYFALTSPDLEDLPLTECHPPQWDKEPELLLGPGPKLQHDDPFVTLYSEFHRAIRRANVCVAIGYSFLHDSHIYRPVRAASRRGMMVIDVNPCRTDWNGTFHRYAKISKGAKEALESGEILTAIRAAARP